jgi:BA14K-like protein
MISLKVLSTAAVMALVLPLAMPSASFADPPHKGGAPGGGARPMARPGGGNFHPGGGGPGPRFSGGGGGGYHRGGGNYGPGIAAGVAGAVIGGAIASQGYYGGPGYYAPGPAYDDQYYDDGSGAVAVAPAPDGGDDSTAYCMQTYRSYDPRSGTYMGNDGYRHPCP